MSGLNLRLNEIEHNLEKSSQVIARYLKAQWLSGLNLRLATCLRPTQLCGGGQTKRKLFNFYFWSTPNCTRLGRRSENYSISTSGTLPTVRGWTDEAKIIQFLLLVHSQLYEAGPTKRKLFNFYFWSTPNCARLGRRSENYSISTSGPLPTVRGWTDEAKIIQFLLLVHSQLCGGGQTKRKLFNFYFWSTPNCAGVDKRSENYSISTSGPLPTVRGWAD
ncbi:hypothetical protein [Globicatella sanguinis]